MILPNKITLIISDIHLGSNNCQIHLLLKFLDEIHNSENIERLIVNGNLFENTEHRLNKFHWQVLSKLRKMFDNLEIILVKGNHDLPNPETLAHLCGLKLVDYYQFKYNDDSVLCIHGDLWDTFLTKYPILTIIADWFYQIVQMIDPKHNLARLLKARSKTFIRCSEKVRDRAVRYCQQMSCDIICCGHVHKSETYKYKSVSGNHITYINSGCWTELPPTYIEFSEHGIEIKNFKGTDEENDKSY